MRVLAINDISCVGKCSLSVSLPILSACGVTCDVLPTALLSTHTGGFQGYTCLDLTDELQAILAHWKTLGLQFDIIYSGYLGSIEQIRLVSDIRREFLKANGTFIVDPVMGDGGKLYAGFTLTYIERMRALCKEADYVLPNVTEACYLADIPYEKTPSIPLLMQKLTTLCPRPIVTGITENNVISVKYVSEYGNESYSTKSVEGFFHGAGDVFSSAFVGCLANGKTQEQAVRLAADFTTAAVKRTAKEVPDKRYGLNFEAEIFPFLKNLFGEKK
ncbi:MAG: pyridoxamine kinase [Clostridia bacterium]|nr:pyridoxamine kinase [Clostridia bacterium]